MEFPVDVLRVFVNLLPFSRLPMYVTSNNHKTVLKSTFLRFQTFFVTILRFLAKRQASPNFLNQFSGPLELL